MLSRQKRLMVGVLLKRLDTLQIEVSDRNQKRYFVACVGEAERWPVNVWYCYLFFF